MSSWVTPRSSVNLRRYRFYGVSYLEYLEHISVYEVNMEQAIMFGITKLNYE